MKKWWLDALVAIGLPYRMILFFVFLALVTVALFFATTSISHAQIPVDVNATASSQIAPADVTVTWTSGGTACTARGDWTGSKSSSGSQIIPSVTSGTKNYILDCTSSTGSVNLGWTPPTKNTDGTDLTNLAKHQVFRSSTSSGVPGATPIDVPMPAVSYFFPGLPTGPYYFGVKAVNSNGTASDMSVLANKNVTGSTGTDTATITLEAKPQPPTVITVDTFGYAVKANGTKMVYELDGVVGTVPLGVPCDINRSMNQAGQYYAVNRTQYVTWTTGRRPNTVVVQCQSGG